MVTKLFCNHLNAHNYYYMDQKKTIIPNLINLPKVALLGRTNVGKSTLFNRLASKKIALTSNIAGTTRDYQETDIEWRGLKFTLIDTGGFDIDKHSDIEKQILNKAKLAAKEAELLVLVVDGKEGPMPYDQDILTDLKKIHKPIILVVTKADNAKKWDEKILEFSILGIEIIKPVSGINGIGSGDLLDEIVNQLNKLPTPKKTLNKTIASNNKTGDPILLAIVGKPNVGKSSLINTIINKDKQIVSDIAHTTRDSQNIKLEYKNKEIILVDTAGIRRRKNKSERLEKLSIDQSLKKLEKSHVTLLVLDISKSLTFQDRHLTEPIVKSGNSVIIIANKWDLIPDKTEKTIYEYTNYIRGYFPHLNWVPILFTSALTKQRTDEILKLAVKIYEERFRIISENALNTFLKKTIKKHPPSRGKGVAHPYIYRIKQVDVNPPTFEVVIKYKKSLHDSYVRFLEKSLREEFKFTGTPLRLFITSVK